MKIYTILKPSVIAASLLFAACSSDDLPMPGENGGNVQLSVSTVVRGVPISRATTNVDMPGTEYGREEENLMSDAVIVVYTHPINNSVGAGRVVGVININHNEMGDGIRQYYNPGNLNNYYDDEGNKCTVPNGVGFTVARKNEISDATELTKVILNDLEPDHTYYAMAFVNFGNELTGGSSPLIHTGMTEEELRNMVYTGPLFTDNSNYYPQYSTVGALTGYGVHREYSHFAMSAINEVKFTTPKVEARDKPFKLGDFYVQRLAARVDICFGVQAVSYGDHPSADAGISWSMLHYVDMMWQDHDRIEYGNNFDLQLGNYANGHYPAEEGGLPWKGLYKYDMDVPEASSTGYPPGGLYRFPIYNEDTYQENKATQGTNFKKDHGEPEHRLPNNIWFWLENIEILNAVNKGEFLLQHSTGTPRYMGHEGNWNDGYPEHFIESPDVSFGGRPLGGRYIGDRRLTPLPKGDARPGEAAQGAVSTSSASDPDEEQIKVRPVPYIMSMLTGTDDALRTIQEYHKRYEENHASDPVKYPYLDFERKFHVSSILGYVGENTYDTYDDGNQYTAIRLTGKTNMANAFTGTTSDLQTMTVTLMLRHSYGAPNLGQPLCYGVVRNTIYKVFLRFFGEGQNLSVRYWYYNGDYSNGQYNMTDVNYGVASFHKYIVESNGTQGAD